MLLEDRSDGVFRRSSVGWVSNESAGAAGVVRIRDWSDSMWDAWPELVTGIIGVIVGWFTKHFSGGR